MNTEWALLAKYGILLIPAKTVAKDYFELDYASFIKCVNTGELDLPLVPLRDSRKSTKMVSVKDLAEYIDKRIEIARKEHAMVYGIKPRPLESA